MFFPIETWIFCMARLQALIADLSLGPVTTCCSVGIAPATEKTTILGGKFMEIWNLSEKIIEHDWNLCGGLSISLHYESFQTLVPTNLTKNMGQGFPGSATWKKCRSNSKVLAFKVNFHVSPRIMDTCVYIFIYTYIYTHIILYIYTYIHTSIHTYIHTLHYMT